MDKPVIRTYSHRYDSFNSGNEINAKDLNIDPDYEFICWLQPSSDGWLGALYVELMDQPITHLWYATGSGSRVWVMCIARLKTK